jgi:hypothetical protein
LAWKSCHPRDSARQTVAVPIRRVAGTEAEAGPSGRPAKDELERIIVFSLGLGPGGREPQCHCGGPGKRRAERMTARREAGFTTAGLCARHPPQCHTRFRHSRRCLRHLSGALPDNEANALPILGPGRKDGLKAKGHDGIVA